MDEYLELMLLHCIPIPCSSYRDTYVAPIPSDTGDSKQANPFIQSVIRSSYWYTNV